MKTIMLILSLLLLDGLALPTRAADTLAEPKWSKEQIAVNQRAVAIWKEDPVSAVVMVVEDLLQNKEMPPTPAQRLWLQEKVLKDTTPVALEKLTADFDAAIKARDFRQAYIASTVAQKLDSKWMTPQRQQDFDFLQMAACQKLQGPEVWKISDVRGYLTNSYYVQLRDGSGLGYSFSRKNGWTLLVVRFTATNISPQSDVRYAPCVADAYSRRLVDAINPNVDFTKPQRLLHPNLCFVVYWSRHLSECLYLTGHDGVLNRVDRARVIRPGTIGQVFPGSWKTTEGPNASVRVRALFGVPETTRVACLLLPGAAPVALPISVHGFSDFEEED